MYLYFSCSVFYCVSTSCLERTHEEIGSEGANNLYLQTDCAASQVRFIYMIYYIFVSRFDSFSFLLMIG